MKLIVFNGSPHKKGETMTLVNELIQHVEVETEVINVFDHLDIKPCVDCGYCVKHPGCAIKDGFNEIMEQIEQADAFIIATPMWFGTISGPMMAFFSRLQTISTGLIFRKDIQHTWEKIGIFMMTTGAKWHSMAKSVETTAEFLFSHLDAGILDFIYATDTDRFPTAENEQVKVRCKLTADRLNQWFKDKEEGRYYKYGYSSVNYVRDEHWKGQSENE